MAIKVVSSDQFSDAVLTLHGAPLEKTFDAVIDDAQVVAVVERCGPHDLGDGVVEVMTVGARVLSAHATGIDVHGIRAEIESTVSTTTASMRAAVEGAIGEDGILASAVKKARQTLVGELRQEILRQADPHTAGSLLAKLQTLTQQFDLALNQSRNSLLEVLRRLVSDMKTRDVLALEHIDKKPERVLETCVAARDTEMESERGHLKGLVFEDLVAIVMGDLASAHGDTCERTGTQPGLLMGKRRGSKRGDITCSLAGKAKVVLEAMHREVLTDQGLREELREAMENRAAQVGVAVIASGDKATTCGQPLKVLGPNMYAVVLDKETQNRDALRLVYCLARKEALAAVRQTGSMDVERVRKLARQLQDRLAAIADAQLQLRGVADATGKVKLALEKYQRDMQAAIKDLLESLESRDDLDFDRADEEI